MRLASRTEYETACRVLFRLNDERPVRFQLNTNDYFVDEVLDQWYGPDDAHFKVRADDGNVYILRREGPSQKVCGHWNRFARTRAPGVDR